MVEIIKCIKCFITLYIWFKVFFFSFLIAVVGATKKIGRATIGKRTIGGPQEEGQTRSQCYCIDGGQTKTAGNIY